MARGVQIHKQQMICQKEMFDKENKKKSEIGVKSSLAENEHGYSKMSRILTCYGILQGRPLIPRPFKQFCP